MSRHLSRDREIKPLAVHADSDEVYKLSHAPKFKNAEQFIKEKLTMLMDPRGFGIIPTKMEIKHLYELETESQINRAVRQIINNHWR